MLAKSEKILMSLDNNQKSPCEMVTTELYCKETKSNERTRKRQSAFGQYLR